MHSICRSEMSDHNNSYYNMFNKLENKEFVKKKIFKVIDKVLIDFVRGHPHLYNQKDRYFNDHLMKENSWKEIALAVEVPALECQKRWIRLRERFGKEKRQRELDSKNGGGVGRRSVFPYYENMSFLNDHIKRRKSNANVFLLNLKRSKTMEMAQDSESHSE